MTIRNSTVEAALQTDKKPCREERMAELEKQLARVKRDIDEQARLDKRYALVGGALSKLRQELLKNLTPEELQAVNGIYIFIHSGCVDMVRTIPSATSKGEDTQLLKDVNTAEAMMELDRLTKG